MDRLKTLPESTLSSLLGTVAVITIAIAITLNVVATPWSYILVPAIVLCAAAIGTLLGALTGKDKSRQDTGT